MNIEYRGNVTRLHMRYCGTKSEYLDLGHPLMHRSMGFFATDYLDRQ